MHHSPPRVPRAGPWCRYPPFADEDQKRLFELIKGGHYSFDDPVWDAVTEGAKDLLRKILVVNPEKRFKAVDILRHPWMVAENEAIPDAPLSGTLEQLKRFNARRRLKKAMQGIRSTVRMKILMAAKTAAALDRATPSGGSGAGAASAGGVGGGGIAASGEGGAGVGSAVSPGGGGGGGYGKGEDVGETRGAEFT